MDEPNIKSATHVHLTGIKGVGMAATAMCLQDLGISISGSDVSKTFITDQLLSQRRIQVKDGFAAHHIPENTDWLVYTGAHQGINNPEVQAAQNRGLHIISQAEAVGHLMADKFGISVCGVGGKTTVSAMLASIFTDHQLKPSFLVGVSGISHLPAPGRFNSAGLHFIAEADEYAVSPGSDQTPKFLHQTPQIIVCTNIKHDHPDVYPGLNHTLAAFKQFFQKLPHNGLLVVNGDDQNIKAVTKNLPGRLVTYGTDINHDYQLTSHHITSRRQHLTFAHQGKTRSLTLQLPGVYNALNALAAYIVSREFGLTHHQLDSSLMSFTGTKRRFEKIAIKKGIEYYDDYAHHPHEITALLTAAKAWFQDKRLIVVFQPHTYSRTKALFTDFSTCFKSADQVIITNIFASMRETKDPSISGQSLTTAVLKHQPSASFVAQAGLVKYLNQNLSKGDVLLTIGAGDIYKIHDQLLHH